MSNTPRSRTPPDLKWLLNERAAIAGRIQKTEARQRSLAERLPRYRRQLEKAFHDLSKLEKHLSAFQATLKALDTTMELAHQSVRPDAADKVNAWAGNYGPRGALIEFVMQLLLEAAPAPVNTRHVASRVAEHFAIPLICPADRYALRLSVRHTFNRLHQQGKVVAQHSRVKSGPQPGIWRLNQPIPTLSDLAAKAQRMAQAAAEANDARQKPADNPGSAG